MKKALILLYIIVAFNSLFSLCLICFGPSIASAYTLGAADQLTKNIIEACDQRYIKR